VSCNHEFTGPPCEFHGLNSCIKCDYCPKNEVPQKPEKIKSNIVCNEKFLGGNGKFDDHFGWLYQIVNYCGKPPFLVCENHVQGYADFLKKQTENKIVINATGLQSPETVQDWSGSGDHKLSKNDIKKAFEILKGAPKPAKYCGTWYVPEVKASKFFQYDDVAEQASSYKYSYGFSNILKNGDLTVLDRIKKLVEVGQEIIRQAETKTPDDKILSSFDDCLKNLREEG
jgi:hypothetical protein